MIIDNFKPINYRDDVGVLWENFPHQEVCLLADTRTKIFLEDIHWGRT
jgi:hypothetical protein